MDNKGILLGVGLATTALLVFTRKAAAAPEETALVYGTITDQDGYPIDGVLIQLGSKQALTDSSGQYELEVTPGDYILTYFKEGYEGGTMSFSLVAGQQYPVSVVMQEPPPAPTTSRVYGQVKGVDGVGIVGVKVTFNKADGTSASTTTSTTGWYDATVPAGTYNSIVFSKSGYTTVTRTTI